MQDERLAAKIDTAESDREREIRQRRLRFEEKREHARRVSRAVVADVAISGKEKIAATEQRLQHWNDVKAALAAERKHRLRELHLAKDNFRLYQSEIRVKGPVRGA